MKLFINEFIKDYKKKTTYIYILLTISITALICYQLGDYSLKDLMLNDWISSSCQNAIVFVTIMFATNLTQEYSKGTIKFLYTTPKSRSSILTSKIMLAIFNYLVFTAISLLAYIIFKTYVFKKGSFDFSQLKDNLGSEYFNKTVLGFGLTEFLYSTLIFIFYLSLVLFICACFKTQTLSVAVVVFLVIGESIVRTLITFFASKFMLIKYLFTNVSLLTSVTLSESSKQLVEDTYKLNYNQLLIMFGVYTLVFIVASYIINARRDITID